MEAKRVIKVGELLRVVVGGFSGRLVRVGQVYESAAGRRVVLEVAQGGRWWDFCTESEAEVLRLTVPADVDTAGGE